MKQRIKRIIPTIILDYLSKVNYTKVKSRFKGFKTEEVFTEIYLNNYWGNAESISGVGSSLNYTRKIIPELNRVFKELDVDHLLDVPCGDFNWMKEVDLSTINYLGMDIVKEIIQQNKSKYEKDRMQFDYKDVIKDQLPQSDLILIRDCFVHFSFEDIHQSLYNIYASKSQYLMMTTFSKQTLNYDITTGDWRPINFMKPPFNFPEPILSIEEHYDPKFKKEAKGKALAIWRIDDLKTLFEKE